MGERKLGRRETGATNLEIGANLLSRRSVLRAASLGGLALVLGGCSNESRLKKRITAYLPISLSSASYDAIGTRLGRSINQIDRIPLAFALLSQSSPTVRMPAIAPELKRLFESSPSTTEPTIAIGGASIGLALWQAALMHPEQFGLSVQHLRNDIENLFQRPTHVTLDCENGLADMSIVKLARAIRDVLPSGRELTLAVGVDNTVTDSAVHALQGDGSAPYIEVMTYDQSGDFSDIAGPVASGKWVIQAMNRQIRLTSDAQIVEVGYPTYGDVFVGAKKMGDPFKSFETILYTDIPPDTIHDNLTNLTSEARINDDIVSCLSPRVIGHIATMLTTAYPNIGGSFFWSMEGLTPEHLKAVVKD